MDTTEGAVMRYAKAAALAAALPFLFAAPVLAGYALLVAGRGA